MKIFSPTLKNIVTMVVSVSFAAWFIHLFSDVGFDFFVPLLKLPFWLVCFVFLGLLLTYVLRGWRVAFEFRSHSKITLLNSIQIVLWHNASVNALPFRSGELAFPLLLQRIAGVPLVHSTASLIHFRMQDASVIVFLCIALLPELGIALKVGLYCFLLILGWTFSKWLHRPHDWHESTSVLKRKAAFFRDAMVIANPEAAWSWLLTICNWTVKISLQALLYVHLVDIEFGSGVLATVFSEAAAFSPVQGIAGFGTFEVSSALAIYSQGVSWSESLQAATQVHLVLLVSAFFWAWVGWIVSKFTQKKINEALNIT